jgi:ComF family protein
MEGGWLISLAALAAEKQYGLMESTEELVKIPPWPVRLAQGVRRFGRGALDMLYPPVCLNCDGPTADSDTLCASCFIQLRPITEPLCPVLGSPFPVASTGMLSAEALADPPPFGRARAAVVYNDVARTLVSRLKYGDRPELASFCARLMASAGHELWNGDPILVPVPLHASRLRLRRYNQSAELAKAMAKRTGLSAMAGLVVRQRRTRSQVGLSGSGRERNVAGAFAVDGRALERLGGRRVIVVDDVYTTGATAKAVTRTLLRSGADSVDVITFARVVAGGEMPI